MARRLQSGIAMDIHRSETLSSAAPDNEIVERAQAGSPEAFAELHRIYSLRLYKTIIAITRNPEDAEDALQETFLRAHLAIRAFEGRSSVYSWLTRIAMNSALMLLRRRRARPEILFDPQPDTSAKTFSFEVKDSAPNPEQVYALRQRRVKLLRAIHGLSPGLRETIRMRVVKGASLEEIGRSLNISETAVKARIHRARRRLSVTCRKP
jgi:RNA polymerase sigma-70 factor, ECF subfamily